MEKLCPSPHSASGPRHAPPVVDVRSRFLQVVRRQIERRGLHERVVVLRDAFHQHE